MPRSRPYIEHNAESRTYSMCQYDTPGSNDMPPRLQGLRFYLRFRNLLAALHLHLQHSQQHHAEREQTRPDWTRSTLPPTAYLLFCKGMLQCFRPGVLWRIRDRRRVVCCSSRLADCLMRLSCKASSEDCSLVLSSSLVACTRTLHSTGTRDTHDVFTLDKPTAGCCPCKCRERIESYNQPSSSLLTTSLLVWLGTATPSTMPWIKMEGSIVKICRWLMGPMLQLKQTKN